MDTRRPLFVILGALILASACERTTSVGAVGRPADADADAAMEGDAVMDADATDRPPDDDADGDAATPTAEQLCTSSGGVVTTRTYCLSTVAPFPNTCAVGTCSPENSHTIPTCDCPGGCFSPGVGCITP